MESESELEYYYGWNVYAGLGRVFYMGGYEVFQKLIMAKERIRAAEIPTEQQLGGAFASTYILAYIPCQYILNG